MKKKKSEKSAEYLASIIPIQAHTHTYIHTHSLSHTHRETNSKPIKQEKIGLNKKE